jgi:CRISPR-associated protein Csm4
MQSFCVTLTPLSAFATPMKGDTLFGQLCWAIRNRLGETHLNQCLEGYTQNQPFAVISDAFPEAYVPLPKLPSNYYRPIAGEDRKAIKKRCWLPMDAIEKPVSDWLESAIPPAAIAAGYNAGKQAYVNLSEKHPQPHNTINRQTNTTGKNGFAPYSIEQEWFLPGLRWTVYLVLDTERLSTADCRQCFEDIGDIGFGRDASIGLGKFAIEAFNPSPLPRQNDANACLTLAPSAPQGLGFDSQRSFYQLFTRFGRHGDVAVHQEGKPFKNPILLAQTAAVFSTKPPEFGFIGQGLGGNGELSKTLLTTVHQGYAPVIAINVNSKGCP